jgi:citronellol/citronellal dehydrogenase
MRLNTNTIGPVTPNPKLPGTIFTAAEEINKAGGRGLPIECDIRSEESVQKAVEKTVQQFGGIDIVINNGWTLLFQSLRWITLIFIASAISLSTTQDTSLKKYDLMNTVNARGTWLVSKVRLACHTSLAHAEPILHPQTCLPYLLKSAEQLRNPHILTLSPPLENTITDVKWWRLVYFSRLVYCLEHGCC